MSTQAFDADVDVRVSDPSPGAPATEVPAGGVSARTYLVLLSLGLSVPLLLFAGYLIWREAAAARALVDIELRQVPRQISLFIDREFANHVTLLEALASSPSVVQRDFARFHEQARSIRTLPGVNITLRDAVSGRMLVNARVGYGPPETVPIVVRDHDAEIIRDKRPLMSNVYPASTRGAHSVAAAIPILENGEVAYILHTTLPADYFTELLQSFDLSNETTAIILDRNDVPVGRSDGPREATELEPIRSFPPAPPETSQRLIWNGAPVIAIQAKSAATGWRVIAMVPEAVLQAPIRRATQVLGAVGLASLALGLLVAFGVGRRISRAIGSLAATGSGLLQRDAPAFADTPIKEVNKVARIIGSAGRQLRETEERLRRSEAGLQESLRVGGAFVFDMDVRADTLSIGGVGPRLLGVDEGVEAKHLAARTFRVRIHGSDYPAAIEKARALTPASPDFDARFRYLRPDGEVVWLGLRATGQFDADGKLVRLAGLAVDATAAARAEEAQARLAAIVEHSNDTIISIKPGGDILTWNAGAERMFGYKAEEVIGRSISVLVPPDIGDLPRTVGLMRDFGSIRRETVRLTKDGRRINVLISAGSVKLPDGTRGSSAILTDITERKRAEARQTTLINELNHRVKNTLSTIQSMAAHTFRDRRHTDVRDTFVARLMALSRAHNVLTNANWESAGVADVVAMTIAPHQAEDAARFQCEGPQAQLPPRGALALAMALHELCTNAAKYGALSNDTGRVSISWRIDQAADGRRLRLRWIESGGPPVSPPSHEGFGTQLVQAALAVDLDATVDIDYAASGLVCDIDAPLPHTRNVPPRPDKQAGDRS